MYRIRYIRPTMDDSNWLYPGLNNPWQVKFARVLAYFRSTRVRCGLSQEELARKSGIPRTTISNIEMGRRNPTLKTLILLSEAMGKELKIHWIEPVSEFDEF